MQRFFVTFPLAIDMIVTDTTIVHQLSRVLRSSIWDQIILFAGDGIDMTYEILDINKKSIKLRWIEQSIPDTESSKKVTLYQAIPNKYDKIEYIIQKWVEIGIARFVFFRSDRSQKLVLSASKIERYSLIAREALEQCGWGYLPEIIWLDRSPSDIPDMTHIVLDTIGQDRRISEYSGYQDIGLWVGPEGGWSDDERAKMQDNGFIFARFGNRVLRTETAGIVISFGFIKG